MPQVDPVPTDIPGAESRRREGGREQPDMAIVEAMNAEICSADPVFRPSKMWEQFQRLNLRQLQMYGIDKFKRSVNQNYFNTIPRSIRDRSVVKLIQFWADDLHIFPLCVEMEDVGTLHDFMGKMPFDDEEVRYIYRLFVGLLWHYTVQNDPHGISSHLSEPEIGDPLRTTLQGKLISQDLANSISERNTVHRFLGDIGGNRRVIAELGAGYGRLGHVFLATEPCRYMIFDIPPALYISQWYLSRVHPGKRVFAFRPFADFADVREEVEAADICFFTANQLALLPDDYIDAFLAVDCLGEMTLEQIARYKSLIARTTRKIVYFKNLNDWTNPSDDLKVNTDRYRLGESWRTELEEQDPIYEIYDTLIFRRI